MSLYELQTKVHVAKDKHNKFGDYNYRTAEGILAAVKAALPEGATIIVTDEIREVAGSIFVEATARIAFHTGPAHEAKGFAMHPLTKKGMDASQITGTASSYARKYALSGLLALDDGSADPDSTDNRDEGHGAQQGAPEARSIADRMLSAINGAQSAGSLNAILEHTGFNEDWNWLEENDPPKFNEVRTATRKAQDKLDPAGQMPGRAA